MATLEDKLLGEKRQYYCSSSESEDEKEEPISETGDALDIVGKTQKMCSYTRNTGPKGVIDDWKYFQHLKQLETEKKNADCSELIKKVTLTCNSVLDDEQCQINESDNILSDNFLNEYRQKRILEMLSQRGSKLKFGTLINLTNCNEFLEAIDNEDKTTVVIIHVYDNVISLCKKINNMLNVLADEYKNVKFCKILSVTVGLSLNFKISGLPAFLVYKDNQLIGNFVRVTDQLGDDFCESDLENFLIEHGILLSQSCITSNSNM